MSSLAEALKIVDTLFDPDTGDRDIHYRHMRGQSAPLYKVWLYLDGPSLPFVDKVTYILHPTFPKPERTVTRSINNPNCQLVIWAWGVFTVKAVVVDKQNQLIQLEHYLTFNQQIADAKRSQPNVKFIETGYNS